MYWFQLMSNSYTKFHVYISNRFWNITRNFSVAMEHTIRFTYSHQTMYVIILVYNTPINQISMLYTSPLWRYGDNEILGWRYRGTNWRIRTESFLYAVQPNSNLKIKFQPSYRSEKILLKKRLILISYGQSPCIYQSWSWTVNLELSFCLFCYTQNIITA